VRNLTAHNLPQQARQIARARAAFLMLRSPQDEARRVADIAALPTVAWKGRTLYTLRCEAGFGRGPHDQHVPESLLWGLIDFSHWHCPFHPAGVCDAAEGTP
jgi:hypothetical protein